MMQDSQSNLGNEEQATKAPVNSGAFFRRRRPLLIGVAALAIVLAVGGSVFYARERAFQSVIAKNNSHTPVGVATTCGTPIPTSGLQKYTLVAGQSTASYSVHEDLIFGNVGSNTAVGKSQNVQGSFYLGLTGTPQVTQTDVIVDLTTLATDSSLRDGHVQDYLGTSQFPNAEFTSTCVTGLPASYTTGQSISYQMTGNLKLHGKLNQEVFSVQGTIAGNTVTGSATATIFMTDFGITPPDLANIAIVDNKVILTINFTAQTA